MHRRPRNLYGIPWVLASLACSVFLTVWMIMHPTLVSGVCWVWGAACTSLVVREVRQRGGIDG